MSGNGSRLRERPLSAGRAVAAVVLVVQLLLLLEGYRHLIYTRRKYRPQPSRYQPRVALISPCKGLDTAFDRNINSFFKISYPTKCLMEHICCKHKCH